MTDHHNAPRSGYLRMRGLQQRIPVARSTIWNWVKAGTFPSPVKLSEHVTAWPIAAIMEWEAARTSAANDA